MTTCTACMQTLDEPGEGRVLVVDGGASKRCALLGDILAAKMHRAGFSVILLPMIFYWIPSGICNVLFKLCRTCVYPFWKGRPSAL